MRNTTMTSKNFWCRRFARAAMAAAVVSSILLAAPVSPALAGRKMADNSKFIPKADGESYVAAYMIVVGSIMLGMMAICRKNYRTTDIKRSNLDKQ